MAMSVGDWERRAARHDREAREDPKGYRRGVARFLALGYLFVGATLLVVLALVGAIAWFGIDRPFAVLNWAAPLLVLGWIVLRSLWIPMDPPDGIALQREEAPELFRMIDEVDERVRGPKLHQVLVDGDFNAGVVQIPRPGLVFGSRNYLLLGLPYMQSLTADELRSTVAHELAHLSANHGRTGAWLYRVEATWWKLLETLEARGKATWLFRKFFEWYLPRLRARSFPLSRANERDADRLAVEAAGAEASASSLARSAIAAPWLAQEYWGDVYGRVSQEASPPHGVHARLREALPQAFADDDAQSRFEAELSREPESDETHPGLRERLEIAGVAPERALELATRPIESTAAQTYLGELEPGLEERLDELWRRAVAERWTEEHAADKQAQAELAQLEQADGSLDDDGVRLRARLSDGFRSPDEALGRWREVLERAPEDDEANLAVGVHLLVRDDDAGLRHLEVASRSLDPDVGHAAFGNAITWLESRGRGEEAREWERRLDRYVEIGRAAGEERSRLATTDRLSPHTLDDETIRELRGILARHEGVKRAWLARKHVEHFDDEVPLHVLLLEPTKKWRTFWNELDADEGAEATLADRVTRDVEELPYEIAVFTQEPRAQWADAIQEVAEPVYDAEGERATA